MDQTEHRVEESQDEKQLHYYTLLHKRKLVLVEDLFYGEIGVRILKTEPIVRHFTLTPFLYTFTSTRHLHLSYLYVYLYLNVPRLVTNSFFSPFVQKKRPFPILYLYLG